MSADASDIECTGCGSKITGGHAFVSSHGWFHNPECVRLHWKAIGYVPGEPTKAPAKPATDDAIAIVAEALAEADGLPSFAQAKRVVAALRRAGVLAEFDALRAELAEAERNWAEQEKRGTIAQKDWNIALNKLAAAEQERDRAREALGAIARNADDADDLSLFRVQCRDFAARALKGEQ